MQTTRPRQLLGRDERQASLLRAAATAFAHTGYAATSMEDVALAAGVTRVLVHRHYGKEDLYRAVLEKVSNRLAEEFVAALERPSRAGLGAHVFLTVAREDPDGFVLLFRHAAREPQFADYAAEFRRGAVAAASSLLPPSLSEDPAIGPWAAEAVVDWLVDATLAWLDTGDPARDGEWETLVTRGLRAMRHAWG